MVCFSVLQIRIKPIETPVLESLFDKVAGLQATLLKRDSNTGVFFIITAKFLRIPVLKNICERLILTYTIIIFPFFSKKGRLPQILPGPFLNTLTHLTQS